MRLTLTLPLLALCAFHIQSHAADTPPTGDSLAIGAGLAYVPEYAGSDHSRLLPLPIIEKTFDNGIFLGTGRGLGYQTVLDGVSLSAALSYGGKRADHKQGIFSGSDALKGMGDINGSAQAVLSAGYQLGTVGLSISTTQNIGQRDHGATYTLGASTQLYASATDRIGLGLQAVYGDNKHMQTYFGVTAEQSARSGYRQYRAKAGFENVNAALSWEHVIDKSWSVHTAAGLTRLTSDAADSPLTKRKTTPLLMTGFSYKF